MKTFVLFIFTGFLLANGCTTKQETHKTISQDKVIPILETKTTMDSKNMDINEQEGWEEFEGNQILKGKLYTSKGAILGIEGVFINQDYEVDSDKPKLRPLIGKNLEVKGDVYIYHCGPLEQCLTQGYMRWLRNVEYVKVIE
ncbi:MAG: hypothetical protein ACPG49_03135 [Chitinophagales bacterium]